MTDTCDIHGRPFHPAENAYTCFLGGLDATHVEGDCPVSVDVGDWVYITGSMVGTKFQVDTADPSNADKMPAFGLVVEKPTTTTCSIQWFGINEDFSGLSLATGARVLWVGVDGQTSQAPVPGVDFNQTVGTVIDSTTILIEPDWIGAATQAILDQARLYFPVTQAGHGFPLGRQIICVQKDPISGLWTRALADNNETLATGVITNVPTIDTLEISLNGRVTHPSHGLVVDDYYFLSDTNPGEITQTSPPNSQTILYVADDDTYFLKFERPTEIGLPGEGLRIEKDGSIILFGPEAINFVDDITVIEDPGNVAKVGITNKLVTTFDFDDAAVGSKLIGNIRAGLVVNKIVIEVISTFQSGVLLKVGDDGDVDRLMLTSENSLQYANFYVADSNYQYASDTDVKIYFENGAGVIGSGRVILHLS
jgi:hypothetical protein